MSFCPWDFCPYWLLPLLLLLLHARQAEPFSFIPFCHIFVASCIYIRDGSEISPVRSFFIQRHTHAHTACTSISFRIQWICDRGRKRERDRTEFIDVRFKNVWCVSFSSQYFYVFVTRKSILCCNFCIGVMPWHLYSFSLNPKWSKRNPSKTERTQKRQIFPYFQCTRPIHNETTWTLCRCRRFLFASKIFRQLSRFIIRMRFTLCILCISFCVISSFAV